MRLSALATNVLNLSRIENQTILGPKSRFNLSEQIRSCILLLERKWNAKHLDLSLDFDEYEIEADPELLKEVWINLLDNAVKFAPEYGLIRVTIQTGSESIRVAVSNTGSTIPPEKRDRISGSFIRRTNPTPPRATVLGWPLSKKSWNCIKDRCMSAVMKTAPPSPWCCLASLTADIHYFRQRTVLKTMPLSVDFFFHFPHLRCCGSLIIQHIN